MNNTQILVGVIILLVVILVVMNKKAEHLDAPNLSNEAIQNISSVYANTAGQAVFNNIKVTGNADFGNFKGIIVMWSGSNVPSGWTLCDGTNGTPDLRGRFVLGSGKGENLTERKINDKGGFETHTLTIEEIPQHRHKIVHREAGKNSSLGENDFIRTSNDIGNSNSYILGGKIVTGVEPELASTGRILFSNSHQQITSDKPHNNMPPFYVLAYIMKL